VLCLLVFRLFLLNNNNLRQHKDLVVLWGIFCVKKDIQSLRKNTGRAGEVFQWESEENPIENCKNPSPSTEMKVFQWPSQYFSRASFFPKTGYGGNEILFWFILAKNKRYSRYSVRPRATTPPPAARAPASPTPADPLAPPSPMFYLRKHTGGDRSEVISVLSHIPRHHYPQFHRNFTTPRS
jgi:hypothetical protein